MSGVAFGRYKRIVRGFFDGEPKNDDVSGSPIWCLGREYRPRLVLNGNNISKHDSEAHDDTAKPGLDRKLSGLTNEVPMDKREDQIATTEAEKDWPADFLDDCESRAWFTYRSGFAPIKKSTDASVTLSVRLRSLADHQGFTSDTGWGCMIRSGQSLLANALAILRLGRVWRRGSRRIDERQMLSLFADDPQAPFSIHRFVEHGASACGKHPGEWFGPSATAKCIQTLSHGYTKTGLKVYVNGDGADVYEDSLFELAKSDNGTFKPTLILVGVRLGIDRVTPVYWDALKASLQLPQSIGIAGGRPSSSHYFFGIQNDQFFYLDPHYTRAALPLRSDPAEYTEEEIDSCHTRRLRRLPLTDMDPSMLLAFLVKDEEDWVAWRKAVTDAAGKPVVHVADTEPRLHGCGTERQSAVDDVETFDDEDESEGEIVECSPECNV